MSDLYNYLKGRSYLPQCDMTKNGCDKYLDCDVCLQDKINEHDKQIRADAIEEFIKMCDKNAKYNSKKHPQNAYCINRLTLLKIAEQLKGETV